MSSSHWARPIVPPKPDKDKISLSSSPRGDASLSPGMRQTVGTQVNIMRKPSPSSTGTSSSTDAPKLKPALPPKPRLSPGGISLAKASPTKAISLPPGISRDAASRDRKSSEAPVARLEEFENLSDLSLSPQHVVSPGVGTKAPIKPPPRVFLHSPRSPPPPVPGHPPQVFKFPSPLNKSPITAAATATNTPVSSIFSQQQIQLRQAKSASLGRAISPPVFNVNAAAAKKSTTLSRVNPLDLSWNNNNNLKSPKTAPVTPSRPINFPRPVTFASETNGSLPPPPPPRLRKRLSIPSPTQPSVTSPVSPTAPTTPGNINLLNNIKPVYATVDKEKKWAERLKKQQELSQNLGNNTENNNQNSLPAETPADDQMDSVVKSSLTIAPSWLGRMIEKEGVSQIVTDIQKSLADLPDDNGSAVSEKPASSFLDNHMESLHNELTPVDSAPVNNNTGNGEEPPESGAAASSAHKDNDVAQNSNDARNIKSSSCTNDQKSLSDHSSLCKNESFLFAMQDTFTSAEADNAVQETTLSTTTDNELNERQQDASQSDLVESSSLSTNADSSSLVDTNTQNTTPPNSLFVNRQVSVQDGFEKDLEVHLENSSNAPNKLSSATFSEQDTNVSWLKQKYVNKPDPSEYLQFVDSRLQSMQHLLEDISKSPTENKSVCELIEPNSNLNDEISENPTIIMGSLEEPRKSDGDIVSNIVLNSKKFESVSSSNNKKGTLLSLNENGKTEEDYRRRSWNAASDNSPSPSESSSSSCSHIHSHIRTCNCRRKQVSSWVDEDELSTGALGDAESSDAPVPNSSTEDIGHNGGGKPRNKKRGLTSIFSSFGKSGADTSSSVQRRSQFFLEETQRGSTADGPSKDEDPSRPHLLLHRTSGFSSISSTGSYMFSSADTFEVDSNFSSIGTVTSSETPTEVLLEEPELRGAIVTTAPASNEFADILEGLTPKQRKSFFVAREILTSERTFVDVLNLLTNDFPSSLKVQSEALRYPVIGNKDLDFILGGLPVLKAVNEVLVQDLETRISNWKESPKVADIIVKKGPFLKHYSTYVRDFEKIMERMDYCCRKYVAFDRAVKDFEATGRCQKLGLKHYMLKPVQRMPQYRLLLEDYLKTLEEDSEDYSDTIKAITIVRDVAEHANEAINLQINAEKLMNLQSRLPNTVVLKTNRLLLKEGELLKVCRKELQPRYFALMTDSLLCMTYNASTGAPNMKDLKFRYELPLTGMRISLPPSEDYQNEFSVISNTRSFNLVAKSSRERDDWMKSLSTAIQDNIKKRTCTTPDMDKEFRIGSQAPVWIHDKRVTMCQMCTAEFTTLFRRHHCRACGKVVCSGCSGNEAPLQYKNNEAARVCDDCYQYLLEEFDKEHSEDNSVRTNDTRSRFKRMIYNTAHKQNKQRRSIPDKFKIQANNSDSSLSGYLQWKKEGKALKRQWFVIKESVLYVFAASEDVVAQNSIPILGYTVEPITEAANSDGQLMFKLMHSGQTPLIFQAESSSSAEKWIAAMQEATVLPV